MTDNKVNTNGEFRQTIKRVIGYYIHEIDKLQWLLGTKMLLPYM